MPTVKPRLTVTFDPGFYETLSRLAEHQGRSKSAVLNELLMSMHEPLMRTVALLDAASDASEDVKRGLRQSAERLERDLVALAGTASKDLEAASEEFRALVGK